MTEGYLLISSGENKYFEMTVCLIKSLRYHKDNRPVSLLTANPDNEILKEHRDLFDKIIDYSDEVEPLKEKFNFITRHEINGILPRLLMRRSPYDRSIFIDSDCMILKETLDLWDVWERYDDPKFITMGMDKLLPGWSKMHQEEIDKAEKTLKMDLREVHAGITWFDKSAYTDVVFDLIEKYLLSDVYEKVFPRILKTWGGRNNETALICALSALDAMVVPYNENFISPNPYFFSVKNSIGDMGLFHRGKTHINKGMAFSYDLPIVAHYFDKTDSENYQRNKEFLLGD